MSATGLEVFDRTIQASTVWVDDLMKQLLWTDRHKAYHAIRAVLHALRDRLPVNVTANFAAQLPLLMRGLFYEGWRPAKAPLRERSQDEFLAHITEAFLFDVEADSRQIASAVFDVITQHVSAGEVDKVKQTLPSGVRELWP